MITLEGADWANDWSVFSTPFDEQPVLPVSFLLLGPADQAQRHQPIHRAPKDTERPGLGRRDRREGQHHLLGDDPVLRGQQHRLVVLALEEDGGDERAVLDQGAARAGTRSGPTPAAGPSRPAEEAQKTFDQLLQNIRLENCVMHPDVVNAIFRRVPGRVEAENYGHEGPEPFLFRQGRNAAVEALSPVGAGACRADRCAAAVGAGATRNRASS